MNDLNKWTENVSMGNSDTRKGSSSDDSSSEGFF